MAAGLYVHVPFCKTKCPYCDFYSVTGAEDSFDPFVDAALEEALAAAPFHSERFDTIYLGGGTPSVLGGARVGRLVHGLREIVELDSGGEITAELNPDDVTEELLGELRQGGVNRLSVGVQSFFDDELASLGRRHDAAGATSALELIRGCGWDNLSIDLMFGWAHHDADRLRTSLDRALDFAPAHLSCYQLTVEGETPFVEERRPVAREEACRDLFLLVADRLGAAGYEHYEVSNYCLPGRSSRHNRKYWDHTPYLGLGPGAHSFMGDRRWWNVSSVERYLESLRRGARPAGGEEQLTAEDLLLEDLYLGLRTAQGVALERLSSLPAWEAVAADLEAEGLVRVAGDHLVPTRAGLLVADGLALRFV